MVRQRKQHTPGAVREPGTPSRHQRRVAAKLRMRCDGYEAVPQNIKGGFKRPGSQNLHHQ